MSPTSSKPLQSTRRRWTWLIVAFVVLSATCWLTGEVALWRAVSCLETRDHEPALKWLTLADWIRPRSAETHFLLARTHRRLRHFDDVTRHLEQAQALGYNQRSLLREQSLAQAQAGQFGDMRLNWGDLFSDAGADGPEISKAFVTGLFAQFRLSEAMKVLNAWQADFPMDADQYFLRGRLSEVQLDHADAVKQYRQVIELQPNHVEARVLLATSLIEIGEIADAASHLERALRDQPQRLDAEIALASCFVKLDRQEEARRRLKMIIEKHPDQTNALLELGSLELATKNVTTALGLLRRAAELQPENREVAYAFAKALQANGQSDEAHRIFAFVDEATKPMLKLKLLTNELLKHPNNLEARFEIAQINWKYNSRAEGAKWWLSLLEMTPDHTATHAALAEHFALLGDTDKATFHRERAIKSEPRTDGL